MSTLTPSAFPVQTVRRLGFLVRLCCAAGFLVGSLTPLYIPESALSSDGSEYLTGEQFLLVEEGFVMKTASISEQGHRLAYSQTLSHRVGEAESLAGIADLYGISLETLRYANGLGERDVIHPGDVLLILPVDGVLHTVKRGQSLLKIAALYDIAVDVIMHQNQLKDERIFAGQQIIIPGGRPLVEAAPGRGTAVTTASRGTPEPPRPTPPPEAEPPPSIGLFQKPCDCTYTQYYHAGHYAVDMSRTGGGPIFAAADGVVIRADFGWNGGYGNVLEIDHGNGLVTLYAHNRALHVREGGAVRRGDVIATMGNTGRVYGRTGVHVHFEVVLNGVKKNPLLYLQ